MRTKKTDVTHIPVVRADEPVRAMEQFTDGLRRVLSAPKVATRRQKRKRTKH